MRYEQRQHLKKIRKEYSKNEVATEPSLENEMSAEPSVENEVASEPSLENEVTSEPSLEKEISAKPSLENEVASEPSLENEIAVEPSLENESAAAISPASEGNTKVVATQTDVLSDVLTTMKHMHSDRKDAGVMTEMLGRYVEALEKEGLESAKRSAALKCEGVGHPWSPECLTTR